VAVIKTAGVLGDKYIEIDIGSADQPELENGSLIQTSEPVDILSKGGNLVEQVTRVFNKGGDVEALLKNLNKLVINLNTAVVEVQKSKGLYHELMYGTSGEKLNKVMAHIEGITGKVNNGDGTLGALVNDPTVYEDIKNVLGGAKRSSVLKYFMNSFIESGKEAAPAKKK
jgi:phospholipid/cholesterol/gamma-HCH transport system substrate-binding protein